VHADSPTIPNRTDSYDALTLSGDRKCIWHVKKSHSSQRFFFGRHMVDPHNVK